MIKKIVRATRRIFYTAKVRKQAKAVGNGLRVNNKTTVSSTTILGDNVNFNGMKIIGGGNVTIGNNFHSGNDCLMISQNHNYDKGKAIPYDDTYIFKDIVVDDNVWLGDRVIILGGVHIGEGAIIQAGSVVVKDIPPLSIAGGHPAIPFKKRDVEHYNNLKKEGSYM